MKFGSVKTYGKEPLQVSVTRFPISNWRVRSGRTFAQQRLIELRFGTWWVGITIGDRA